MSDRRGVLTGDQIEDVKRMAGEGKSNRAIAAALGVTHQTIGLALAKARAAVAAPAEASSLPWHAIKRAGNPRQAEGMPDLLPLAESIDARGVLVPLIVRPLRDGEVVPSGNPLAYSHVLIAGQRRHMAVEQLIAEHRATLEFPMPVVIRPAEIADQDALLEALTENLARADMHPLDEGAAFKRLQDYGMGTEGLAGAVGVTQRTVQSRIRLVRRLSAASQEDFRAGRFSLAQAEALCHGDERQQAALVARIEAGSLRTEADILAALRPAASPAQTPTARANSPAPSAPRAAPAPHQADIEDVITRQTAPSKTALALAHDDGRVSFRHGTAFEDCPHNDQTDHELANAWCDGWRREQGLPSPAKPADDFDAPPALSREAQRCSQVFKARYEITATVTRSSSEPLPIALDIYDPETGMQSTYERASTPKRRRRA
jgi:ParB family chromosome partitioning protein